MKSGEASYRWYAKILDEASKNSPDDLELLHWCRDRMTELWVALTPDERVDVRRYSWLLAEGKED